MSNSDQSYPYRDEEEKKFYEEKAQELKGDDLASIEGIATQLLREHRNASFERNRPNPSYWKKDDC